MSDTTRTLAEARAAINQLTRKQLKYLLLMASRFSTGLAVSPEDVVQSSLLSVLTGERHWPTGVEFLVFLIGVIRSTAFAQRQLKDNNCDELAPSSEKPECLAQACPNPTPEEKLISQDLRDKQRQWLYDLMESDQEAIVYLHALAQDWSKQEIQTRLGFDDRKLDTVQTRLRRRIDAWKRGQS